MLEITWQERDGSVLTEQAERWTKDQDLIHITTPGSQLLIPIRGIRWIEIRQVSEGTRDRSGPDRLDRLMLNLSHPSGAPTVTRGERPERDDG